MKTVLRTTEVVKQQSAKVFGWFDGQQVEIYFKGPTLYNSPAKILLRDNTNKTIRSIRGRVFQGKNLEVFFLQNKAKP